MRSQEKKPGEPLRGRCDSFVVETDGFTFSDERNNRNHIRLGYSIIETSRIPEGIDKIASAVPHAVPEAPAC